MSKWMELDRLPMMLPGLFIPGPIDVPNAPLAPRLLACPGPCSDNTDDYVVFDPLLEAGKAKFNKQQAKHKKQQTEWGAGRGPGRGQGRGRG